MVSAWESWATKFVNYRLRLPRKVTGLRLTGERPIEGKTPDSLLALHSAGYREVLDRIGGGRFLDIGCGLGDGSALFLGDGRTVFGVDYDPATAIAAHEARSDLRTAASDGSRIAVRTGSVDWVCSSHLIEHFVEPEGHVAESARVLGDEGAAFFITPNAPADFENPYHVYLFDPDDLRQMLGRHFEDVTVMGLDGDAAVKADFERRRKLARTLLKLDPWGLRHKLPRSWFVGLHAFARRVTYPFLNRKASEAPPITAEQFSITETIDPTTLVLFAVAKRPKR